MCSATKQGTWRADSAFRIERTRGVIGSVGNIMMHGWMRVYKKRESSNEEGRRKHNEIISLEFLFRVYTSVCCLIMMAYSIERGGCFSQAVISHLTRRLSISQTYI